MGERYGACKSCYGMGTLVEAECGGCGGTGFSGDAMDLIDPRNALRTRKKCVKGSKPSRSLAYEHALFALVSYNEKRKQDHRS